MKISQLLQPQPAKSLERAGYTEVEQLFALTDDQITMNRYVGKMALQKIRNYQQKVKAGKPDPKKPLTWLELLPLLVEGLKSEETKNRSLALLKQMADEADNK